MSGLLRLRPEVKAKWLAALRSGKYRQVTGVLHDTRDGDRFCCLGVLCDLAVEEGVTSRKPSDVAPGRVLYGGNEQEAIPPIEVAEWAFDGAISNLNVWVVADPEVYSADELDHRTIELAALNDDLQFSFNQIADRIEEDL